MRLLSPGAVGRVEGGEHARQRVWEPGGEGRVEPPECGQDGRLRAAA